LLLNVFEMLENDFLDFTPISWGQIVGVGFFEIEIFAIQPIFTFLLSLATVDMSRLIAFIRIEKYSPAQKQKDGRHLCIVFLLRLTAGASAARGLLRVRSSRWLDADVSYLVVNSAQ
jgi:hypothetical protein